MAKTQKSRIEALRKAGMDTRNYFSICSNGDLSTWKDGKIVRVLDSELEELERSIFSGGTINSPKLYRRFIMAQYYWIHKNHGSIVNFLNAVGNTYAWKVLVNEYNVLANMEKNGDEENLRERARCYRNNAVMLMMNEYINALEKHVDAISNGRSNEARFRISNKTKTLRDWRDYISNLKALRLEFRFANTYSDKYSAVKSFSDTMVWLHQYKKMKPCTAFKDSYKFAGAYYTMKNMILFHGCRFEGEGEDEAIESLNEAAEANKDGQGYIMVALCKNLINASNFDFKERMHELGVEGY